ncbi:hypothetical protein DACRYDRAFT_106546 [Dacryopinax primogenitus]|uniref:Uncharacterized protein n=1 Tax=Dacryopinax primogenitus (strain DJM 731) TaxID=1858805 RepID=M5GEM2_DACPD|nr:uncharacterized protein DACRYDRAFT_106546 [Dacryopinax primogenitus]EJU03388.1 hypothetical protein DACRYDRAFT_106546 [Dacryopinax primogenitus]
MLKTAAMIIVHMHEDTEDPIFLPLVKYSDLEAFFANMVMLLVNSPQSALVCNLPVNNPTSTQLQADSGTPTNFPLSLPPFPSEFLHTTHQTNISDTSWVGSPEKWVHLFAEDQQAELATLSVPVEEEEEEDKEEKEFKATLSGFLMSLASMDSPLVKAEKGKAKAKEMTPSKLDTWEVTKEDSRNVGWMMEETLAMLLLVTMDEVVVESFSAENCIMFAVPQAHHLQRWCGMPLWSRPGSTWPKKVVALPPVPAEQKLFCLETPKPTEKPAAMPANKKKWKLMHTYVPAKANKCKREEKDEGEAGTSQKQSCLPEAEIELPVVLLCMAEHKMLKMWKSLQVAQKAVTEVTAWADQIQTLLGRDLTE